METNSRVTEIYEAMGRERITLNYVEWEETTATGRILRE